MIDTLYSGIGSNPRDSSINIWKGTRATSRQKGMNRLDRDTAGPEAPMERKTIAQGGKSILIEKRREWMERKRKPLVEGTRRSELKNSFIRNCGVHWLARRFQFFFVPWRNPRSWWREKAENNRSKLEASLWDERVGDRMGDRRLSAMGRRGWHFTERGMLWAERRRTAPRPSIRFFFFFYKTNPASAPPLYISLHGAHTIYPSATLYLLWNLLCHFLCIPYQLAESKMNPM